MHSDWHTLSQAEIFKIFDTGEVGLSTEEASQRLHQHGPNKLPEAKADGVWKIFLRQFQSPLIYVLLVASIAVFLLGDTVDSIIILIVILFNSIIGSIQEGKAQNTLLALKNFASTTAMVRRNGREAVIPDSGVVIGDILLLSEGSKIPADARVLTSRNLKVDEASLTGESESVHKISSTLHTKDLTPTEQRNMVFKGTHVVSGNGLAVTVATGEDTLIGQVASTIKEVETEIPLKANIRNLSRLIVIAAGLIAVVIFFIGIAQGLPAGQMLVTVISVTVSIIPEGLLVAMTLVLAAGVWRMSKNNALVKRLQAVEALGQASVIAVDKTGTITRNEMTIRSIWMESGLYDVGGVGYDPRGEVTLEGMPISASDPEIALAGKIAAYCANARAIFDEESKIWNITGDPTEASMHVLALKLGIDKDTLERHNPPISELPFTYKIKRHTVIHQEDKGGFMTLVGAPEVVLALSEKVWRNGRTLPLSDKKRLELEERALQMSRKGERVLAFAMIRNMTKGSLVQDSKGLVFVGFFGLKDALRKEVKEATRQAQEAGIQVVMITGDHVGTAEALAREAGIFKTGDKVLSGTEVDNLSDEALVKALARVSVFARVTPEHKMRIINAYKARGETIAMTGDGVNDAPSLVAADLGVAMGKIGTEVAKEASDIVLLDDNFGSIVSAVEEGRSIYKTIRKVILYLLSTSFGEVLVITGSLLLGMPLPLLPAQIIWLNFVTDGFLNVALSFEPKEEGLLKGKFIKPSKYIIDGLMAKRILLMALPMMIFTLLAFSWYYEDNITKAWTISLTLLAAFQWFNAWNCRSETQSVFSMNPFANRFLLLATLSAAGFQVLAVYHPFFQKYLHTTGLSLAEWVLIITLGLSIVLVEELRKLKARKDLDTPPALPSRPQLTKPSMAGIVAPNRV